MPFLSRLFIRSSMICFVLGFTAGGVILSIRAGFMPTDFWAWLPTHILILLVGWMVQLSMGVAYWILPRNPGGDRGRAPLIWGSFYALQIGLILTALTLLRIWLPSTAALLAPGVILLTLAVIAFALHAVPRIRPTIIGLGDQPK